MRKPLIETIAITFEFSCCRQTIKIHCTGNIKHNKKKNWFHLKWSKTRETGGGQNWCRNARSPLKVSLIFHFFTLAVISTEIVIETERNPPRICLHYSTVASTHNNRQWTSNIEWPSNNNKPSSTRSRKKTIEIVIQIVCVSLSLFLSSRERHELLKP